MNSRQLAKKWPYNRRSRFVSDMRKAATNWFKERGCTTHAKHSYCLADWNDWTNNIILPEVADYLVKIQKNRVNQGEGFALHDYVHHGLSSQALLFNLIGPLMLRDDLVPLRQAMIEKEIKWPGGSGMILEYEDRTVFNEDSGQPTSIDLVIGDPDRPGALYIECKFTESEFGSCSVFMSGDCEGKNPVENLSECYLHHIGRQYWTLMEKKGFITENLRRDHFCVLSNNYQFFREILVALEKDGYFVLLSDDRSPTFSSQGKGLLPLLIQFIPDQYRNRIGQIDIKDLVKAVEKTGNHNDWIYQFKKKYGIEGIELETK